jgi:hypothetical protein
VGFTPGGYGPLSDEDKRAIAQRQERIRKDADPALLARAARWEQGRGLPRPRMLPQALRPQPTHFDDVLHDWRTGYLGVRDQYEAPYELQRDLKQCVPQSVLRDLYRPVRSFFVEPTHHELGLVGAEAIASALKEARASLVREPVPVIEPALAAVVAEQRRRRRLLATPWQSLRPDSAPRRYSEQDHIRYVEFGPDGEPLSEPLDQTGAEAGDEAGSGGSSSAASMDDELAASSPGLPAGALRRRRP